MIGCSTDTTLPESGIRPLCEGMKCGYFLPGSWVLKWCLVADMCAPDIQDKLGQMLVQEVSSNRGG